MVEITAETNRRLRKKVQERKSFVEKAVKFIDKTVQKYGIVVIERINSSNTHVIKEFKFGHFKFQTDYGQTMMGGNTVSVWYNKFLVFKFDYHVNVWEGKVSYFETEENTAWLSNLRMLMREPKRVAAQIKKDKVAQRPTVGEKQQQRLQKEHEILESDAKRLMVI